MSIFNHFQHIKLTNDQLTALDKIQEFLNNDENIFILQGYAGSGKTTILKGICSYLQSQKQVFNLMAPTGRAAMILNEKTGFDSITIHRGIYNIDKLEVEDDNDTFKYYFGLHQNEDSSEAVYFIDESSMISDYFSDDDFFRFGSGHLLKDLIRYVFEGSQNRKIVFVGDDAQLPPVDMNFSPALSEEYLTKTFNMSVASSAMTQVVRQEKNSGILLTAGGLRKSIEKKEFNLFEIPSKFDDISVIDSKNFISDYTKIAKKGGVTNSIIISHSNKQALEYNKIIRTKRYGVNVETIQAKDILIITKNNYNHLVELFNGMFVTVLEVGSIVRTANPKFKIKGGRVIQRELHFREVLIEVINGMGEKQHLNCTLIDNFLNAKEGRLHPYDQTALFVDFKNRNPKLKPKSNEFKEALKNDKYFNALQAKYGYAITCHKSQGGEWENVIVDFKVFLGKTTSGFYRWAYTSITRSQKNLFCIDAPTFNALSRYVIKDIQVLTKFDSNQYYLPSDENVSFLEYRLNRIKDACSEQDIACEAQIHSNQIAISFKQDKNTGSVQLWFGKKGFTKNTFNDFQDEPFKELIQTILQESLYVKEITFNPRFEFQKDLHQFLMEVFLEEGACITNIIQNEWFDRYYILSSSDCAYIDFHFKKEHFYSYAQPHSLLGKDDVILNNVVKKLKG